MKSLDEQVLSYAAYHSDRRNKMTHFFGVPLVTFSVFLFLGWFRFVADPTVPLMTAAALFSLGVFVYYLMLDWRIALLQMPLSVGLLWLSDLVALLPFGYSVSIFAAAFVGGWVIQLVGHGFEGRRPALLDNFTQLFNAPLFLTIEILMALGYRKDLRERLGEPARRAPELAAEAVQ